MDLMCQAVKSGSRSKGKCLQGKVAKSLQIVKADGEMTLFGIKGQLRVLKSEL